MVFLGLNGSKMTDYDKNKDNHINEGKVIAPKVPMPEPQKSGKDNNK